MLAILLFTLLFAEIPCSNLVLLWLGHLPGTHWGHCDISANTKLVNSQSWLLAPGSCWWNSLFSAWFLLLGWLLGGDQESQRLGTHPQGCFSWMTTQPVWLQQKFLSSNPNYCAGTALWVVFSNCLYLFATSLLQQGPVINIIPLIANSMLFWG